MKVVGGFTVLTLGLGACLPGAGGDKHEPVSTFEVHEEAFVRSIRVDGLLKPVKTSPLTAPAASFDGLTISWMAEDGSSVKAGDIVVRFDATDASRSLESGKADGEAADRRIEKERTVNENTRNERERVVAVTKQEMDSARQLGKKDPRYFSRAEVIESEIDEGIYSRRLAHARSIRSVEAKVAESRIDVLAVDRSRATRQTRLARQALSSLVLRAPHDGTFLLVRWNGGRRSGMVKVGERVFPGMRLAQVATSEKMTAEIYVLEADAAGLTPGKAATVVLEARPDVTLKAHVARVDPFPKPIEVEIPAQYFFATLDIEADTAGLKPGQRLHATLILDQQDKALVLPRQALFRRDDDAIVYRKGVGAAGFSPVKVTLGPGTVGRVVVLRGLSVGDQVALRDPNLPTDDMVGARASGNSPAGSGKR